jgi:hypothetical protein
MLRLRYFMVLGLLIAILAAISGQRSVIAQTSPSLGTADSFAVLAGSTATNTGSTLITGNLGVWPGTEITGFPPGVVNGTEHPGDGIAQQAQSDVTAAYNDLAGRACDQDLSGSDLGGLTLVEGVYCFSDSAQLTGQLTLDAEGNADAVFIFQIGSTLTTDTGSSILIANSGSACNLFWQVGSSATLGTSTSFAGNILALTSITLNTNANVSGRALAQNGAVTMDTNNISNAACVTTPIPTETPPADPTATPPPSDPTATPPPSDPTATPPPSDPTATPPPSDPTATPPPSDPTATPPPSDPTATPVVAGLPDTGGFILQGASQFVAYSPLFALIAEQEASRPAVLLDPAARIIDMPFELQFPSLRLNLPLAGVGLNSANVMDVPRGTVNDPAWQTAFWYRGSSLPGEWGTTTIAGHVTDLLGQPGAFAHLKDLRPGDPIIVYDQESGRDIEYIVTKMETYSARQSADPLIIEQVYGDGSISFGRSYLTLITCAGAFVNGSFVDRLVVYAEQMIVKNEGLYKPQ